MDFPIEIQSEFDYIVRAFQFVAMMFGPGSGYMGLLATLGSMGIFFGGMSAISAQAMSGKAAIQSWLVNMLVAAAIIVMLLGSKSTVIIHDTVSNQMRSVGGVPTVMATLAYMENRISQGVKDMMETVMQPIIPYDDIGRGEGFELLASINKGVENYIMRYPYIFESMADYVNKCALNDVSMGWIKKADVHSTVNLWEAIRSETRTRYSIVYAENDARGSVAECADAWTLINNMLKASQVNSAVRGLCEAKYTDTNAINECMQNQENIVSGIMAGPKFSSIDLNSVIVSYLVSSAMHSSKGGLYRMRNDMNKKNASSAFMAETEVPKLKGMLYGIIIGLFPLLVCFIWFSPTKTVMYYAGMFLFLILWGAIDTYLNMQYLNETYNAFTWLRNLGLGVNQMFDIPNEAAGAVGRYGGARWLALGLAATISSALTGASSYAMSQMGSQMSATAQSSAASNAGYLDSAGNFQLNKQASMEQGQRELGLYTPVANYSGYADQTYQQEKTSMMTGSGLKEHYGSNDIVANANATTNMASAVESNAAAKTKLSELGGLGGIEKLSGDRTTYDVNRQTAQLDFMKDTFGGLANAGKVSGNTEGVNQAENIHSTKGKIQGAGSVDNLLKQAYGSGQYGAAEQGAFLTSQIDKYGDLTIGGAAAGKAKGYGQLGQNYSAYTNYQEVIGNTDATNKMAAALGMNVSELAEFSKGRNVLDDKTADFLNNKYGSDMFKAGQTFNFSMRKDNGQLTEMSLADNVKGKQLGSYTLDGTQSTMLNDDGSVASNRYDGIFSKDGKTFAGGITTGQDDNVINASGSAGSELYDKLIDTQTTQLGSQYSGVLHNILSGKKDAFARLEGLSGDELEAEKRLLAGSIATELNMFRSDNENQQWGTNLKGDISGSLNFNSGEQVAGWVAQKLSGASISGGVNVGAGINKQDMSESKQNINAAEIYDIIHNADGNVDTMADNTKAYLQDKIGENLSGMGVAADAIKEGWNKFEQIGGTVGITIGKNSETGKPMAEVTKSWKKK